MSEGMVCPGCTNCSSSILSAFDRGEPCPICGLSPKAAGGRRQRRPMTDEERLAERRRQQAARDPRPDPFAGRPIREVINKLEAMAVEHGDDVLVSVADIQGEHAEFQVGARTVGYLDGEVVISW